ncbi:MAG TPA: LysM peptidoglycan-binding domain-containing protein [Opitutaceae bacterium]
MKIIKILGIAAGLHAVLALILIFASPGCSSTKAADTGSPAITAAPASDAPAAAPAAIIAAPDSAVIRYSPTRPGTAVASALEEQPVSDVTPASAYTVARGDNLSSIAKKNKLTKADLAAANNLKSTSILHPGQKLIIPSKKLAAAASVPAPAAATAEPSAAEKPAGDVQKHVVVPGETLSGIAHRYGIKQGDIAVANNITDPKRIQPGQELIIPAKSAASAGRQTKSAAPTAEAPEAVKSASPPASDQDLDAGLKAPSAAEVPVVKIEDASPAPQPKNP